MHNVVPVDAVKPRYSARRSVPRKRINVFLLGLATAATSSLFVARPALAQTWVGDGSNPFWDIASNWSTGAVPGAGADVTNSTAFTVNYRQDTDTVNSYTSNDGGAFLMSGGILNLIAAFTTNGDYTQAGGTFTSASFTTSSSFTLSNGTMNVGSFTQTGAGALTLSGGTLNITSDYFGQIAAFTASGNYTQTGGALTAGSFNTSSSFTLSGGTMNVAGFTQTGSSPLTLAGGTLNVIGSLNTHTALTLSGGTLENAMVAKPFLLQFGQNTGNVLDNVILSGNQGMTINGSTSGAVNTNAYVRIADAFTFVSGFAFAVGGNTTGGTSSYLLFDSTSETPNPTFGSAVVSLGSQYGSGYAKGYLGFGNGFANTGETFTIGSGTTVQGSGTIGDVGVYSAAGANLVNNGIVNANQATPLNVTGTLNGNVTNNGTLEVSFVGKTLNVTTSGTGTLLNTGLMEATPFGSILTIDAGGAGGFTNSGTITAIGGQVYLEGPINSLGTLSTNNGIIALNGATVSGTVTAAEQSALSFTNNTSNLLDNVALAGPNGLTVNGFANPSQTGYISACARIADSFSFTSGAVFNIGTSGVAYPDYLLFDSTGATPNPTFDNATVNIGNSNVGTNANVGDLGFGKGFTSANTLTFGSGLTIQGTGTIGDVGVFTDTGANIVNNGTITASISSNALNVKGASNGAIVNNGTIQATALSSSLTISSSGTGSIVNNGILQANGSLMFVASSGTGGFSNNGTISSSNKGVVYLERNINTLGSLSISSGGAIALLNGMYSGIITADEQSALSYAGGTLNVFDNVTLESKNGLTIDGTVAGLDGGDLHIADSFNFSSGAVFNLGTNKNGDGFLFFDSTSGNINPTFDNATVNLGGSSNSDSDVGGIGFGKGFTNSSNTLTLGSALVVQGIGAVGIASFQDVGANLVNNGTISADIATGVPLGIVGSTNGTITNNGLMQSDANASSLTITANGTGSVQNSGTIRALNKGNATISGLTFTNAGVLQVNSGSSLTLSSTASTQSAGTTIDNGTLQITNASNASNTYTLQGGAIYGTGTISGNIANTGATFGAGTQGAGATTGKLTQTGSYTQSGNGIFSAALGGTAQGTSTGFDFFTVSGNAVLGGYLDVDLINGFAPTAGETFKIISDTSQSGSFVNTPGNTITDDSGSYMFAVVYGTNSVQLIGLGQMPEPGAGSYLLLALVPGAGALAVRRGSKWRPAPRGASGSAAS